MHLHISAFPLLKILEKKKQLFFSRWRSFYNNVANHQHVSNKEDWVFGRPAFLVWWRCWKKTLHATDFGSRAKFYYSLNQHDWIARKSWSNWSKIPSIVGQHRLYRYNGKVDFTSYCSVMYDEFALSDAKFTLLHAKFTLSHACLPDMGMFRSQWYVC